jgi:hypothetical protein
LAGSCLTELRDQMVAHHDLACRPDHRAGERHYRKGEQRPEGATVDYSEERASH